MLRKRSATKKNSSGWNIKTILLESFFILLAVLLALLLNEWNNDRNNQKLVNQILESAKQEISENLEIVSQTLEYRSELLNNMRGGTNVIQRFRDFTELTDVNFNEKEALQAFLNEIFLSEGMLDLAGNELIRAPDDGYWMQLHNITAKLNLDGNDLVIYGPGNVQLRPAYVSNVVWTTANASNVLIHMDFNTLTELSDIYSTQESYSEIRLEALNILYSAQGSILPVLEDMFWLEQELKAKYTAFLDRDRF